MEIIEYALIFTILFSLTSIIFSKEKFTSKSISHLIFNHIIVGIIFVWIPATVITILLFNEVIKEVYPVFLLTFGILSIFLFLCSEVDLDGAFVLMYFFGFIFFCIPLILITWFFPWYFWIAPYFPYVLGILIAQFSALPFFYLSDLYHPQGTYDIIQYYKFDKEQDWKFGGILKYQKLTESHIFVGQFLIRCVCYAGVYILLLNMFSRQDILIGLLIGYLIFELVTKKIFYIY